MELRLQLLESFVAAGSDGHSYKVRAYERLAPDVSLTHAQQWVSTGQVEYRLDDDRRVEARRDGSLRIAGTDVVLRPAEQDAAAEAGNAAPAL